METRRLTLEETSKLLNSYRETQDKEALELLVLSNMGLVGYFSMRYLNRGVDYDDLKSAGIEGLIRAINKFDIEKSIKAFSTYISVAIDNQIKMEVRKQRKHNGVMSLDAPISSNTDGDEITIKDIIGTDEEQLFNDVILKLKVDILKEVLQSLTYREQQIILLRYGLGNDCKKTQGEIAEIFNVSQVTIFRQEQRALVKMRHPRNTRKLKDFINV